MHINLQAFWLGSWVRLETHCVTSLTATPQRSYSRGLDRWDLQSPFHQGNRSPLPSGPADYKGPPLQPLHRKRGEQPSEEIQCKHYLPPSPCFSSPPSHEPNNLEAFIDGFLSAPRSLGIYAGFGSASSLRGRGKPHRLHSSLLWEEKLVLGNGSRQGGLPQSSWSPGLEAVCL